MSQVMGSRSQKTYSYNTTGSDVLYATPDEGYNTNSTEGLYAIPHRTGSSRSDSKSSKSSSKSSRFGYQKNKNRTKHQSHNHVVGKTIEVTEMRERNGGVVGKGGGIISGGAFDEEDSLEGGFDFGEGRASRMGGGRFGGLEGGDGSSVASTGSYRSSHTIQRERNGGGFGGGGGVFRAMKGGSTGGTSNGGYRGSHTIHRSHYDHPSDYYDGHHGYHGNHIDDDFSSNDTSMRRYHTWHSRQTGGLDAGKRLGVEPILTASELAQPDVDELAVMAYASGFHKRTSFGAETYAMKQISDYGKCAKIDFNRLSGLQVNHRGGGFTAVAETPAILYVRIQDQHVSVEDISAQIESPGSPVPISLKALSTELVEVQFTPVDVGIHKVTVRCRGENVQGSPVSVDVEKDMSSYPQNVRVPSNITAIKGEQLTFQVDTGDAGQGDLTVDIRNNQNSIPSRVTRNGKVYTVHAVAKEVGIYKVVMKWNNESISDDVMQIAVSDATKVKASGEGLFRAREDTPAIFTVDPKLAGPGQLRVQVEGPNSMAKVSMDENQDGTYTVTYIPVEVGLFTLKIFWGDRQIQGSPYHIKVTDPRRVRILENSIKTGKSISGVYPMVRNEIFQIGFDSSEAGPGIMQADLDTPTSRVPLNVETPMEGRQSISFIPDELGDHELKVSWSGFTIKESPVRLFSKKEELPIDHNKVKVTGEGREISKVNRHTEFNIDGSRAGPGVPGVRMSGADCDVDVKLQHLGNHIYNASYIPEKPGTYLLHLTWSDKQVPGSPFKVNVAGESYANRVIASGVELKTLVADRTSRIVIDGRDAGSGDLTARCMGPTKQAEVMIGDNQDNTYSLLITPKEQGRHVLEVKYGTEHIQGSPFVLRVAGAPDASQVRCFGPGLEHGILSTFKGRFICETKGAGAGQLKVRVHGPRGGFRVEMKRNNNRDRNIDVTYNPTETGEYNIHVKWSDKHVPGSPFTIKIVDSEDELREARKKIPTYSSTSIARNGEMPSNGWAEEI